MAVYSGNRAISKTLAGATVDTVTLTGNGRGQVYNRGAGIIWFTDGRSGSAAPADPTVGGDDCIPVMPGTKESVTAYGHSIVKIIGNGDAYTVTRT